ncbi:hypothetical protein HDU81_009343 [Chytriomyces hyalinus]|nr:hypothetical protein HDU81_009343 [Chytriomyces hyalinus]
MKATGPSYAGDESFDSAETLSTATAAAPRPRSKSAGRPASVAGTVASRLKDSSSGSLTCKQHRRNKDSSNSSSDVVEKVKDAFAGAVLLGTQKVAHLINQTTSFPSIRKLSISSRTGPECSEVSSHTFRSTQSHLETTNSSELYLSSLPGHDIDAVLTVIPNFFLPELGELFEPGKILKYFGPLELIRYGRVSKAWMKACGTDACLWVDICVRSNIAVGPDTIQDAEASYESKAMQKNLPLSCLWKEVWMDAQTLKRNWTKGEYSLSYLKVADARDAVTCLCFNSDQILIGTSMRQLTLLPSIQASSNNKQVNFRPEHTHTIMCAKFSSSIPNIAASGDSSGKIKVWNTFTGKLVGDVENAHTHGVSSLFIVEKSKFGVVAMDHQQQQSWGHDRDSSGDSGVIIVSTGFDCLIQAHWLCRNGVPAAKTHSRKIGRSRAPSQHSKLFGEGVKLMFFMAATTSNEKPLNSIQFTHTPAPFSSKSFGDKFTSLLRSGGDVSIQKTKQAQGIGINEWKNSNYQRIMGGLRFGKKSVSKLQKPDNSAMKIIPFATWKGHTGHVYCVEMMPCGKRIVSGSLDSSVRVWCIRSKECLLTLTGHTDTVTCVHPTGDIVFSGSLDRTIRKWNSLTGATEYVLASSKAWIKCLDSNSRVLVSSGGDGNINVWDMATGIMLHKFELERGPTVALQVDERKIVAANRGQGCENEISILDFSSRDSNFISFGPPSRDEAVPEPAIRKDNCDVTDYQNCVDDFASASEEATDEEDEVSEIWEVPLEVVGLQK